MHTHIVNLFLSYLIANKTIRLQQIKGNYYIDRNACSSVHTTHENCLNTGKKYKLTLKICTYKIKMYHFWSHYYYIWKILKETHLDNYFTYFTW